MGINSNDENITFVRQKWYGQGHDLSTINEWCTQYCKSPFGHFNSLTEGLQPGLNGKIVAKIWFFHDPKDALLFKLKWG